MLPAKAVVTNSIEAMVCTPSDASPSSSNSDRNRSHSFATECDGRDLQTAAGLSQIAGARFFDDFMALEMNIPFRGKGAPAGCHGQPIIGAHTNGRKV